MNALTYTILGAVLGLIALAGLFVAADIASEAAYWGGLMAFAIGVLVDFWLINRWFDGHVTSARRAPIEAD